MGIRARHVNRVFVRAAGILMVAALAAGRRTVSAGEPWVGVVADECTATRQRQTAKSSRAPLWLRR